jgi:protein tyrosine phosphatase (PTP) superfamily phosphohydrolase (DUF442 family)
MEVTEIYNQLQVFPGLSTSGVIPEGCFEELSLQGYQRVINLLPADSEYAVKDEAALLTSQGIEYIYIPVDFTAPRRLDFDLFAAAMDAAVGQKVWVHCAANYRVSAFVSLYNQMRHAWSDEQADALVAQLWKPDEVWTRFIAEIRSGIPDPGFPA